MNQWCKVCDEPAAGFHFGAFTCEGCKSFFGRAHTNPAAAVAIECKTGDGRCVIDKKNRTSCKACRLKKCLAAGMSKSGSRYGRRSNWFKVHCLLQQQQQHHHQQQQHQQQRHRQRPRREIDRDDRCCGDDDDDDDRDDKCSSSPADRMTRPRAARLSPLPLPSSPVVTIMPLLFRGFAPKSRAPLPRSEHSAFRETVKPARDHHWCAVVARHHDDDDDRPVDLTVRQKFARQDDDDNNNETAGKYDSALPRPHHEHDTAAPLDLTRSDVRKSGIRS